MDEDRLDVVLGGDVAFHEEFVSRLASLDDVIADLNLDDGVHPFDKNGAHWIRYYYGGIGIVWDKRKMPVGWVPKRFDDIRAIPKVLPVSIPEPESSASRSFLAALSHTQGHFSVQAGKTRYEELFTECMCSEDNQPETTRLVGIGLLSGGVEWPHDAFTVRRRQRFSCIGIALPDDAVFRLSAVSVVRTARQEPTVREGARALVRFVLSETSQREHYEDEVRLPITRSLLDKALKNLPYDYVGENLHPDLSYLFDERIVVALKALRVRHSCVEFASPDERRRAYEQSGCSP